jgi:hypothetical protein
MVKPSGKIMRRHKLTHLLNRTAILTLLLAPGIQAEAQRPKSKAATPKEAVKYLLDAARADDVDGFQAQLGAHTRAGMQMARAFEAYYVALEEKFGKNPKPGSRPSVKEELLSFKRSTYQVRNQVAKGKERVDLTVWEIIKGADGKESIQEETWVSIKEPAGWKIVLPPKGEIFDAVRKDANGKEVKIRLLKTREFDARESAREEKWWREAEQVLERLTKDIKAGKYPSREKAEAALDKARKQLQKQEK